MGGRCVARSSMPPYGCLARVRLASRGLSRQRQRLPYQMGGSERHERTRDTQRAPTRSHHLSPTRAHHRLCDSPASQQQQQQHGASCTNGGAARRRATSSLVTWARCGRAARPGKLRGRRRRQSRLRGAQPCRAKRGLPVRSGRLAASHARLARRRSIPSPRRRPRTCRPARPARRLPWRRAPFGRCGRARASSTPSRRGSSAAARSPTPAGTAVAMR
mmetsp:Transcript_24783/g.63130  ORF Transcript_24783/g.63130 Transcript_24783/m.63130 type:complete len:218 (+) Transcript_24783:183-836(+)